MPTPAERSALLFVAAVAALGVGVRGCRALRPEPVPPDARQALAAQIAAVDSAIAAGGRSRRGAVAARTAARADPASGARGAPSHAKPTAPPPTPIDVDRASAELLETLPGIGPALARRIIASRDSAGGFGSLEGLQRVRGIGPALAKRLDGLVTFSGLPRPTQSAAPTGGRPHP